MTVERCGSRSVTAAASEVVTVPTPTAWINATVIAAMIDEAKRPPLVRRRDELLDLHERNHRLALEIGTVRNTGRA